MVTALVGMARPTPTRRHRVRGQRREPVRRSVEKFGAAARPMVRTERSPTWQKESAAVAADLGDPTVASAISGGTSNGLGWLERVLLFVVSARVQPSGCGCSGGAAGRSKLARTGRWHSRPSSPLEEEAPDEAVRRTSAWLGTRCNRADVSLSTTGRSGRSGPSCPSTGRLRRISFEHLNGVRMRTGRSGTFIPPHRQLRQGPRVSAFPDGRSAPAGSGACGSRCHVRKDQRMMLDDARRSGRLTTGVLASCRRIPRRIGRGRRRSM